MVKKKLVFANNLLQKCIFWRVWLTAHQHIGQLIRQFRVTGFVGHQSIDRDLRGVRLPVDLNDCGIRFFPDRLHNLARLID